MNVSLLEEVINEASHELPLLGRVVEDEYHFHDSLYINLQ